MTPAGATQQPDRTASIGPSHVFVMSALTLRTRRHPTRCCRPCFVSRCLLCSGGRRPSPEIKLALFCASRRWLWRPAPDQNDFGMLLYDSGDASPPTASYTAVAAAVTSQNLSVAATLGHDRERLLCRRRQAARRAIQRPSGWKRWSKEVSLPGTPGML